LEIKIRSKIPFDRILLESKQKNCILSGYDTNSVEILDIGSSSWRPGPRLPQPVHGAPIVQHPNGGVIMIISYSFYYLANAGPTAQWQLLPQKLAAPRDLVLGLLCPG